MTVEIELVERNSGSKHDRLLQDIAHCLAKSKKFLAVTGAGISCNSGIPDFRSEDGLYNLVKRQYPNVVVKGKDLFDTVLFSSPDTIQVFFTFISHLRDCILKARPAPIHKFIKHMKDKKRLLRCYTQNIDGLEVHEGLQTGIDSKNWKKLDVVQLHGDIHKLKCLVCSAVFDWCETTSETCKRGEAPECPACTIVQEDRAKRNKRQTGVGRLKPNIVLYGEEHPDGDLIGRCTQSDIKAKPDFLLIAGTSLKVSGIQKLVKQAAKAVKAKGGMVVLINKTKIGGSSWKDVIDYHIEADCDAWVSNLKMRIPDFFAVQSDITKFAAPKKLKVEKTALITPPSTPVKSNVKNNMDFIDTEGNENHYNHPNILTPPPSHHKSTHTTDLQTGVFLDLPTPTKCQRSPLKNITKKRGIDISAEFASIKKTKRS